MYSFTLKNEECLALIFCYWFNLISYMDCHIQVWWLFAASHTSCSKRECVWRNIRCLQDNAMLICYPSTAQHSTACIDLLVYLHLTSTLITTLFCKMLHGIAKSCTNIQGYLVSDMLFNDKQQPDMSLNG